MKKSILTSLATFAVLPMVFAADLNNNGDITATGTHDVKATRNLIANQTVSAGSAVNSSNTIWAAGTISTNSNIFAVSTISTNAGIAGTTYVASSNYITAAGAGYFGDFLRVGGSTTTPASKAVLIGQNATAGSFNALVVGRYNLDKAKDGTTAPTPGSWVDNDPLLLVGNGNGTGGDPNQFRNAFAVYKDGTITMSKAQGDILMGQFGN